MDDCWNAVTNGVPCDKDILADNVALLSNILVDVMVDLVMDYVKYFCHPEKGTGLKIVDKVINCVYNIEGKIELDIARIYATYVFMFKDIPEEFFQCIKAIIRAEHRDYQKYSMVVC